MAMLPPHPTDEHLSRAEPSATRRTLPKVTEAEGVPSAMLHCSRDSGSR